jgi:hypothetical protein
MLRAAATLEVKARLQLATLRLALRSRCPGIGAMPFESRDLPEQEISIKARAREVYEDEPARETRKLVRPFPVVLRETPAEPLSGATKAVLWIVGAIVAVLFIAAIWRVTTRHGPKPQTRPAPRAAKTSMRVIPPATGSFGHGADEPAALLRAIW